VLDELSMRFAGRLFCVEELNVDLAKLLAALPNDALVTVRWLRAQLEQPEVADDSVADLSCAAVAKLLDRTPGCIRGWCQRGEIVGVYRLNGREWRIPRASLRAYQAAHGAKRSEQNAEPVNLGSWREK